MNGWIKTAKTIIPAPKKTHIKIAGKSYGRMKIRLEFDQDNVCRFDLLLARCVEDFSHLQVVFSATTAGQTAPVSVLRHAWRTKKNGLRK
jgi:hypothetical protein